MAGEGLARYRERPALDGEQLVWNPVPAESGDPLVLAPASKPFSADGGLKLLTGNLGRAVIKTSAVKPEHRVIEAPALVFATQEALMAAFQRGELHRDFVAVVRFQGPRANGMPELHKLTPPLGVLQDQGFRVALVTDHEGDRNVAAGGQQVVVTGGEGQFDRDTGLAGQGDDFPQSGDGSELLASRLDQRGIGQQELGSGVLDDLGDLLRRQPGVQRDKHAAGQRHCEMTDQHLGAIRGQIGDPVALL